MDSRKLVTIVIDSNAIWNDWLLERPAWEALHVLAEHGLIEVSVPEVVVHEVVRGHKGEARQRTPPCRDRGCRASECAHGSRHRRHRRCVDHRLS